MVEPKDIEGALVMAGVFGFLFASVGLLVFVDWFRRVGLSRARANRATLNKTLDGEGEPNLMSHVDPEPTYACGNHPLAGDLVEYGTRHRRMLVLEVCDDQPLYTINCAGREYAAEAIGLMVLVARYGVRVKKAKS